MSLPEHDPFAGNLDPSDPDSQGLIGLDLMANELVSGEPAEVRRAVGFRHPNTQTFISFSGLSRVPGDTIPLKEEIATSDLQVRLGRLDESDKEDVAVAVSFDPSGKGGIMIRDLETSREITEDLSHSIKKDVLREASSMLGRLVTRFINGVHPKIILEDCQNGRGPSGYLLRDLVGLTLLEEADGLTYSRRFIANIRNQGWLSIKKEELYCASQQRAPSLEVSYRYFMQERFYGYGVNSDGERQITVAAAGEVGLANKQAVVTEALTDALLEASLQRAVARAAQ